MAVKSGATVLIELVNFLRDKNKNIREASGITSGMMVKQFMCKDGSMLQVTLKAEPSAEEVATFEACEA